MADSVCLRTAYLTKRKERAGFSAQKIAKKMSKIANFLNEPPGLRNSSALTTSRRQRRFEIFRRGSVAKRPKMKRRNYYFFCRYFMTIRHFSSNRALCKNCVKAELFTNQLKLSQSKAKNQQ